MYRVTSHLVGTPATAIPGLGVSDIYIDHVRTESHAISEARKLAQEATPAGGTVVYHRAPDGHSWIVLDSDQDTYLREPGHLVALVAIYQMGMAA